MRKLLKSLEAVLVVGLLICGGVAVLRAAISTAGFDPAAASVGNAKLLALGIEQYTQDYDERLPIAPTEAKFQALLAPYVKNPSVFISPETGQPFAYNSADAGQTHAELGDLSKVVIFQDAPTDGTAPLIAFLDGHVERNGIEQGDPKVLNAQRASALALAVLEYSQDYDETLPPTDNQADFQDAVTPYTRSSRDFYSLNGQPFEPNPALSRVNQGSISDPHDTILFQDTMPYVEGVQTVGYADGHVTPAPAPESDAQNLSKLRLGVAQYVQDYDQKLPPTNSSSAFQAVLQPYVKDSSAFVSPDSGLPYTLNASVSEESITSFSYPSDVVLLQDPRRNNDGSLNALYVDYHISTQYDLLPTAVLADSTGLSHVFWRDGTDEAALWTVSAAGMPQSKPVVTLPGGAAIGQGLGADGMTRVLWNDGGGAISLETVGANGSPVSTSNYGPYDGWTPQLITTSATDSTTRILWRYYDGRYALWNVARNGVYLSNFQLNRIPDGTPAGLAVGTDGDSSLLWLLSSGGADILTFNAGGILLRPVPIAVPSGYHAAAFALGADNIQQVLTVNGAGAATILTLTSQGRAISRRSLAAQSGMAPSSLTVGPAGDLRVLFTAPGGGGILETVSTKGAVTGSANFTPY